jgi:hypothetical protein
MPLFRGASRFAFSALTLSLAFPVSAQYSGAKPAPAAIKGGFDAITEREVRDKVWFLASQNFAGRSPMEPGYAAAAGYAASYLRELGLKPAGDNGSYFQYVALEAFRPDGVAASLKTADGTIQSTFGRDFSYAAAPQSKTVDATLVVLHMPHNAKPDDLAWNTLRDRVVLLTQATAQNANPEFVKRVWEARPSAVLVPTFHADVQPSSGPSVPEWLVRLQSDPELNQHGQRPYLRLTITSALAQRLADYAQITKYAQPGESAFIESSGKTVSISAPMTTIRTESLNVLAKLEGRDNAVKTEHLMLGAHLDHLGQRNGKTFYGADDNASGTAAVLLAAKALASNPQKPRRSVLVALWTGEESGLLGSSYFVKNPVVPLSKIVAYLNLDMVGRDGNLPDGDAKTPNQSTLNANSLAVAGRTSSADFEALLREQNRYVNFQIKETSDFYLNASDTGPFVKAGIPSAFFFSGLHSDYHRPSDTPDKINFAKVTNAAKWAYISIWQAAERSLRIKPNVAPAIISAQN